MAHNGAKAGFITSPAPPSGSRLCRFVFLSLLVSIVAVSYYCWTTTVNNSMLQDRLNRLSRDFPLMRNQRAAAEKNLVECKTRVSAYCCRFDVSMPVVSVLTIRTRNEFQRSMLNTSGKADDVIR